jgi:hypothetical protein
VPHLYAGVLYTIHKRTHPDGCRPKNRDAAKLKLRVVDARYYAGKALSRLEIYDKT